MYISQDIANRIKMTAKTKGIALKDMLADCDLGINLISHLAKGQAITYINMAKIADYLDCSVDYLLGRTETPLERPTGILTPEEQAVIEAYRSQSPEVQAVIRAALKLE